jgi:hypothetical protein
MHHSRVIKRGTSGHIWMEDLSSGGRTLSIESAMQICSMGAGRSTTPLMRPLASEPSLISTTDQEAAAFSVHIR